MIRGNFSFNSSFFTSEFITFTLAFDSSAEIRISSAAASSISTAVTCLQPLRLKRSATIPQPEQRSRAESGMFSLANSLSRRESDEKVFTSSVYTQ